MRLVLKNRRIPYVVILRKKSVPLADAKQDAESSFLRKSSVTGPVTPCGTIADIVDVDDAA